MEAEWELATAWAEKESQREAIQQSEEYIRRLKGAIAVLQGE